MFGVSRQTWIKSALVTAGSVVASVSIVLAIVPLLGGHPDGPGFWMSVVCPMVIAGPASLWQLHQKDVILRQRDELARMHVELEGMHVELRRLHEDLRFRARRDALTGGLNREALFSQLGAIGPSHSGSAALLVIDADHFKRINDAFGHLVGDEALRRIAACIGDTVESGDVWGRIGGEEFVVFLADADTTRALHVTDRLRRAVAGIDLVADGRRVPVSASIGAATVVGRFDPVDLFRRADEYLYLAKDGGRDRIVFDGRELAPPVA